MLIIESFFQAIASIKQNKMRSILTMIGIIIGIMAVISIRMIGNSMSDAITEELNQLGMSNIFLGIEPKETDNSNGKDKMFGGGFQAIGEQTEDDYYKDEMLEDLKEHFNDEVIGTMYSVTVAQNVKIVNDSQYSVIGVFAVNEDYMRYKKDYAIFQKGLLAGDRISTRAMNEGRSEIIISDRVCKNIFPKLSYDEIIGQEIEIPINEKSYTFHVKGVYETDPEIYEGLYDDSTDAYIPYIFCEKKLHISGAEQVEIAVNPDNTDNVDELSDDIESYMRKYYHNNKYWDTSAYSMASYTEQTTGIINGASIVLMIVAGIALLVGGIGVMNIMLVSVSERTREIGIRKSLGATNAAIQLQFVIESIVLSLSGGILGIVIGRMVGKYGTLWTIKMMSTTASVAPRLDIASVIIAVGFSAAIGVFFGYYPATKASKLNPIDALRD